MNGVVKWATAAILGGLLLFLIQLLDKLDLSVNIEHLLPRIW